MANRFLNNIRINDEYTFPVNDGSAGQAIVTDGSGNLSFGSAIASSADSTESVHISVKNTSGSQILKGTPVYVTGETGNSGKIEIAPADASNSAKMPALGILESTLSNNAEGFCVQGGLLEGLATATIDGTSTTANDTVYVKAGGGLTMTKPTGSNLIQNIAKVARVHASNGSLVVSSILRTNDVPNLTTGKIWVGQGNTIESTVVHLDETNGRMGVGTTSPGAKLEVAGTGALSFKINNTQYSRSLIIQQGGGYSHLKASHVSGIAINYGQGNPGILSLFNNTTQAVKINTNGNSYFNGGNVGIGTTSPNATLKVQGPSDTATISTSSTPAARINNGGAISLWIGSNFYNYGYVQSIQDDGSNNLKPLSLQPLGGNIGIGTTSPDVKLEVIAASPTDGIIADFVNSTNAGGTTAAIKLSNSDSENCDVVLGANRVGANFGSDFFISLSDSVDGSNQERFRITEAGNVGIGTDSPGQKLDVSGNIKMTETAAASDTDKFVVSDSGVLKYRTGAQVLSDIGAAASSHNHDDRYYTETESDDRFLRQDGSGKEFVFEVNDEGNLSGNKWYKIASVNQGNGGLHIRGFIANHVESFTSQKINLAINGRESNDGSNIEVIGTVDVLHNNETGTDKAGIRIIKATDSTYDRYDVYVRTSRYNMLRLHLTKSGNTSFYTSPTPATTEPQPVSGGNVEIDTSSFLPGIHTVTDSAVRQVIKEDGNVGIGTTSPASILEVKASTPTLRVAANERTTVGQSNTTLTLESQARESTNNRYSRYNFVVDPNNDYGHASLQLHYLNDGVDYGERLRIDSSGNVGIGTTSPGARLDVAGNGNAIQIRRSNGFASIKAHSDNGGNLVLDSLSTAGAVFLNHYVNRPVYIATGGGNVGIGTTSPSRKLDVRGDAQILSTGATGLRIVGGNTDEVYMIFGDADDNSMGGIGYDNNTNELSIDVNNSEAIRIDSSGNVGIGTTNPGNKLHIVGNTAKLQGSDSVYTAWFITNSGTGNAGTYYDAINGDVSGGDYGFIGQNNSGYMEYWIGANSPMPYHAFTSGNVGIGTTSPSQKLDVSGNIKMTETAATTDTDKFVVLDSGVLKYRTGAEVISDLPTDSRYVAVTGDTMTGALNMDGNLISDAVIGFVNIGATQGGSPAYNYKYYRITNDLTFDKNRIYELLIDADDNGGYSSIYHIYISQHNNSGNHDRVRFHYISGDKDRAELLVATDEHVWVRATAKWGNIKIRAIHENEDVSSMPFATTETRPTTQANGTSDFVWNGDNNTFTDQEQWHAGNDGSGSGLDADLLDGQHESYFLNTSGTAQTKSGNLTINGNLYLGDQMRIGDDAWIEDFNVANAIKIKGNQNNANGYIAFGSQNDVLGRAGTGALTWAGSTVWHAGNDGSGSGLDADLLDGQHASAFLTSETDTLATVTARGASTSTSLTLGTITLDQVNMKDRGDFITFYGNDNNHHAIGSRDNAGNAGDDLRINSYHNVYFNLDSNNNNSNDTTGIYVGQHGAGTNTIQNAWSFYTQSDGITFSSGSFRAPIFYDSNDTSYYLNPNSTTTSAALAGRITIGQLNTANSADNWSIKLIENSGNCYIGNHNGTAQIQAGGYLPNATGTTIQLDAGTQSYSGVWAAPNGKIHLVTAYSATYGGTPNYDIGFTMNDLGNVGIGTDSPTHLLTLETASSPGLKIKDTTQGATLLAFSQDSNSHIGTYSSHPLVLDTNSSERMRITSAGNVGIGTTNPATKLHIGTLSTSGVTTEEFRIQSGTSSGNGGTAIANLVTGSFGTSGIYFGNQSTYTSQDAYLKYADSNNTTTLNFSAILNLESGSSGSRMYINSAGNVGIGTTSPQQKLDVNGDIAIKTATQLSFNTSNGTLSVGGHAGQLDLLSSSIFINYTGDVGIGTTNPGAKLQIDSASLGQNINDTTTQAIFNSANANQSNLYIQDYRTAAGNDWTYSGKRIQEKIDSTWMGYMQFNGDSNNGGISFGTGLSTTQSSVNERMRITSAGNVGIGTSSPSAKLTVVDDILLTGSSPSLTLTDATSSFVIKTNTAGEGVVQTNGTSKPIRFFRNNGSSESMRIDGAGNVGIGTTSPSEKLHVSSNDQSTARIRLSNTNTGSGGDNIDLVAGVHNVTQDGFSVYNATSNQTQLVIQGGGNVGIGTTSPAYQLQLSTNSAAKPTSSAWTVVSDERVKTNIRPYETGLQELLQIEPKLFDYNGKAGFDATTKNNIGVIAQEIKDVMPETVKKYNAKLNEEDEEDTELYNFDSHALTFALINSVKELNAKIKNLETKIQTLENQ